MYNNEGQSIVSQIGLINSHIPAQISKINMQDPGK